MDRQEGEHLSLQDRESLIRELRTIREKQEIYNNLLELENLRELLHNPSYLSARLEALKDDGSPEMPKNTFLVTWENPEKWPTVNRLLSHNQYNESFQNQIVQSSVSKVFSRL